MKEHYKKFDFWFWIVAIIFFAFLIGYKLGLHRVIGFMNA
jgi:hypothetical protein